MDLGAVEHGVQQRLSPAGPTQEQTSSKGKSASMLNEKFAIHDASDDELPWLLNLAETLAEITVPPLRGVWGKKAREFAGRTLRDLIPYRAAGLIRFLIATDRSTGEKVGYVVLNMNHESPMEDRETYIEDLGVVSDYLGKRVAHFLGDQAARISREAGVDYLGAHISYSNRRALLTALSNGFELESYRIVRPCTDSAVQTTKDSEGALERQEQNEKMRRVLLSRKLKRRQRQADRSKRKRERG